MLDQSSVVQGAEAAKLPLARLTVLDLTHFRAGPVAVRHLADWGANVICIEPPGDEGVDAVGKSRAGADYQNLHRNKRMVRLDLKSPEGHSAFLRLAAKADVIVENMRPSVKNRLKIAYEDVRPVNPRIVYGSISGFGQTGPYKNRAGVDQIAQGMGGIMSVTGYPDQGPLRVGIAINDLTAGNLLAFGIMMALFDREHTGVGRWVHTSLLEAALFMLDFQGARWLMEKEVAGPAGNAHPTSAGPTGVFPTTDIPINIAGGSTRAWVALCDAVGHPEWKTKPEWANGSGRAKNCDSLNAALSAITREKPAAHWVELFEEIGIPCGPIYTIDKAFSDPQVRQLGMAIRMTSEAHGETEVIASPLNMNDSSKDIRIPTRRAGVDTDDVLREIGLSAEQIAAMRAKGIIQSQG